MLRGQFGTTRGEGAQQCVERLVALQAAQVPGVGARDVDGDVVGVRVDAGQRSQVVIGGALYGGGSVLADVQAQQHGAALAEARALHIGHEGLQALVVEAQAVDQGLRIGQAEHAGPGIARLTQRGDGADFHEAEAHGAKTVDAAGVFVQSGREADAVGKAQAREHHGVVDPGLAVGAGQGRVLRAGDEIEREFVGRFRGQAKQHSPRQGIRDQRHRIIPVNPDCPKNQTPSMLTQDELKAQVGQAALQYVVPGEIVGVGTGSTVNKFIEALASMKDRIAGAVSSSEASTQRLQALGIRVFDANDVGELAVYIDGADEIDGLGCMIKGGGAALTREKIVAAQSRQFVCIADESKRVAVLFSGGPAAG